MFDSSSLASLRSLAAPIRVVPAALCALLLAACSGDASVLETDGGRADGALADGGSLDAGRLDGGGSTDDGGAVDGGGGDVDGGGGAVDGGGGAVDSGGVDASVTPGARIVTISTGEALACALYDDGAVFCWGDLSYGVPPAAIAPPTRIAGVDAIAIAAGSQFACAITRAYAVVCWGTITFGTTYTTPTVITGAHTGAEGLVEIAAGQNHACVSGSGRAYCWGANHHGHLGDGTTADRAVSVETALTPGLSSVTDLGLGQQHSCALLGSSIRCWGWSQSGQAGSAAVNNTTPIAIAPFVADAVPNEVDGGSTLSCVRIGGQVGCWGSDENGEFGDGSAVTATRYVPVAISGLTDVESLSVDGGSACIVRTSGAVACWGDNRWSSVSGPDPVVASARTVTGLPTTAAEIAIGSTTSCALLDDGDVWCWGFNGFGTLGNPAVPSGFTDPDARSSAPVMVVGLP